MREISLKAAEMQRISFGLGGEKNQVSFLAVSGRPNH
jgi:hypothetical protein